MSKGKARARDSARVETRVDFGSTNDTEYMLETQNDIRLKELSNKVGLLRGVTNDIYQDVNNQNSFLDGTGQSMGVLDGAVTRGQRELSRVIGSNNSNLFCYLTILIVISFFLLNFLISKLWSDSPK